MIKVEKHQSLHEERVNALIHGIALFLSILSAIALTYLSIKSAKFWHIVGSFVYCGSLLVLYASSTYYHYTTCEIKKARLNIIDHCSIYFFIAGSYTLVLLTLLSGLMVGLILSLQWTIAIIGTIYKFRFGAHSGVIDSFLYLLMGWMIVFFYKEMMDLPDFAFSLLVAGGLCYSVGVLFFLLDHRFKYFHAIWHLMVIAGTVFHSLIGFYYIGQ